MKKTGILFLMIIAFSLYACQSKEQDNFETDFGYFNVITDIKDTVYFVDGNNQGHVKKLDEDGVSDIVDESGSNFQIYKNSLYYINQENYIICMDLASKKSEKFVDFAVKKMRIISDKMYYIVSGNEFIYVKDLSNQTEAIYIQQVCSDFYTDGDDFYYIYHLPNKDSEKIEAIFAMRSFKKDDNKEQVLLKDAMNGVYMPLDINDDWICYCNLDDKIIYRVDRRTAEKTKLVAQTAVALKLYNGNLYYATDSDNSIYKTDMNSAEPQKICSGGKLGFTIIDNWLITWDLEAAKYNVVEVGATHLSGDMMLKLAE